jgi:hypothetical protein
VAVRLGVGRPAGAPDLEAGAVVRRVQGPTAGVGGYSITPPSLAGEVGPVGPLARTGRRYTSRGEVRQPLAAGDTRSGLASRVLAPPPARPDPPRPPTLCLPRASVATRTRPSPGPQLGIPGGGPVAFAGPTLLHSGQ